MKGNLAILLEDIYDPDDTEIIQCNMILDNGRQALAVLLGAATANYAVAMLGLGFSDAPSTSGMTALVSPSITKSLSASGYCSLQPNTILSEDQCTTLNGTWFYTEPVSYFPPEEPNKVQFVVVLQPGEGNNPNPYKEAALILGNGMTFARAVLAMPLLKTNTQRATFTWTVHF